MELTTIPQRWVESFKALPDEWLEKNTCGLLKNVINIKDLIRDVAQSVGVAEQLLITRMQLEQNAITYAWDGSTKDYEGGFAGDATKLKYLCGVDKTDSGPRTNGWFGPEKQLLGCALRFKYWYRGKDGPRKDWKNWLGLKEDPKYKPGVAVIRNKNIITPANQASADCLRYTSSMPAQKKLAEIGRNWFMNDYLRYSGDREIILQTRNGTVIDCNAKVEGGTVRVDIRPLLEYYDIKVYASHLSTLNKIFVDDKDEEK